jgi:hypothetical protein
VLDPLPNRRTGCLTGAPGQPRMRRLRRRWRQIIMNLRHSMLL